VHVSTNHLHRAYPITHEFHRPTFIRPRGGWLRYCFSPADPPPPPNTHRPPFLAVQPVHPLVIGRHPFAQQHRPQSPIAKPHAFRRQLFQTGSRLAVPLRFPCPIAMRRSSQSRQPAGVPLSHLVLHRDIAHHCPKAHRRYQFFESASFNARLSRVSSATHASASGSHIPVASAVSPRRCRSRPTSLPAVVSLLGDPVLSA
jgi:hypothetical protein